MARTVTVGGEREREKKARSEMEQMREQRIGGCTTKNGQAPASSGEQAPLVLGNGSILKIKN